MNFFSHALEKDKKNPFPPIPISSFLSLRFSVFHSSPSLSLASFLIVYPLPLSPILCVLLLSLSLDSFLVVYPLSIFVSRLPLLRRRTIIRACTVHNECLGSTHECLGSSLSMKGTEPKVYTDFSPLFFCRSISLLDLGFLCQFFSCLIC